MCMYIGGIDFRDFLCCHLETNNTFDATVVVMIVFRIYIQAV